MRKAFKKNSRRTAVEEWDDRVVESFWPIHLLLEAPQRWHVHDDHDRTIPDVPQSEETRFVTPLVGLPHLFAILFMTAEALAIEDETVSFHEDANCLFFN